MYTIRSRTDWATTKLALLATLAGARIALRSWITRLFRDETKPPKPNTVFSLPADQTYLLQVRLSQVAILNTCNSEPHGAAYGMIVRFNFVLLRLIQHAFAGNLAVVEKWSTDCVQFCIHVRLKTHLACLETFLLNLHACMLRLATPV